MSQKIELVAEAAASHKSKDTFESSADTAFANATASATTYLGSSHSTGVMFENSVNQQNNEYTLSNTIAMQGILSIYRSRTKSKAMNIIDKL